MTWGIVGIVIVALVVVAVVASRGRAAGHTPVEFPAWEALARRHQLSFQPGSLVEPTTMAGDLRGFALEITLSAPPAGELSVRLTTNTLLAEALLLRREVGAARVGAVAGLQDIQIGDARLDPLLRIQGLGDEHIQQLLGDDRVHGPLGRLFSRHPEAVVDKDHVLVRRTGVREPPADFQAILDAVLEVAQVLDEVNRELTGSTLGERPQPTLAPPTTLEEVPHTEDIYEPLDTAEKTTDTLPAEESVTDEGSVLDVEDDETAPEAPSPALALLVRLGDRDGTDADRTQAIEASGPLLFRMVVDGVARTTGDVPEGMKKGRTVQGHLPGHVVRTVAVRFPPARNDELEDLRSGGELVVEARPVAWDGFARRLTLDGEG